MRVFVAGATGVLGRQLLPMLVSAGHDVWGLTRTPDKVELIRAEGAEPIIADALDANSIMAAVIRTAPEVVLHEMTALSALRSLRKFDQELAMTNRLRTEGTRNLLQAAIATGARRFIAQSFAGWPFARQGGLIKTEDDPLDPNPPKPARRTLDAIRELESLVISARELDGLILRYGFFYGPGTSLGHGA